ncbi:helix-turn-helix domain-containing protein [Lacipirellula limnantheis]|uniref:Helix-turn-helix domain protein n=1 Tax=Lacipirellula limnantheis TaxID=2528024 RepID=A0A517U004_9BACT|nr:helix-turn-helix domain-containing protein [Lacipirellula limnantheis]QDT73958.1 Helix-turn-helix domain protein [Lacipirellula limnantheis]
MEQKFVKFEEAIEKLGISAERLNQLREEGELRAYRDGSSWKFRSDEIERMVTEGIPDPPPPSDISLVGADDLVDSSPLMGLDDLDDLKLADDDDLSLGSELELAADQDDTVTAGGSDPALSIHDGTNEGSDPSDSILLSEEELGESLPAASTIIGRSKANSPDADLNLVTDDDLALGGSDVALAGGASNVLSSGVSGSGVLDELDKASGATSAFEDLEELELDLAAESSRILSPAEAAGVAEQKGAFAKQQAPPDSDLKIEDDLEIDDGTDPVPEVDLDAGKSKANAGPTSDLELATDEDDFVLATDGGSDITLDSGDSGINLSPSDSGLALDDIPLEIGGSAILDSLTLGGGKGESDLSLIGSDIQQGAAKGPGLQTDDDFRLTPLGEKDDDGDSSSQVIALDADLGDLGGEEEAGILGDDAFAEIEEGDGVMLSEDYGDGAAGEFEAVAFAGAPTARAQGEYTLWNILGLASCFFLMMFAGMLSLDMVRNIWSWEDNLTLNDSLLESLGGMFGLR